MVGALERLETARNQGTHGCFGLMLQNLFSPSPGQLKGVLRAEAAATALLEAPLEPPARYSSVCGFVSELSSASLFSYGALSTNEHSKNRNSINLLL